MVSPGASCSSGMHEDQCRNWNELNVFLLHQIKTSGWKTCNELTLKKAVMELIQYSDEMLVAVLC